MSELLRRFARLTRAQLFDLLAQHWPGRRPEVSWERPDASYEEPAASPNASPPPFGTHTRHGLPYSADVAEAYRALDLPYGAPMGDVAKRWKTYLKRCHPDRYAKQPDKLADATKLTQELTNAYEKIKTAWERHHG